MKNKELIEKLEKWLNNNPWLENICVISIIMGLSYLIIVNITWLL